MGSFSQREDLFAGLTLLEEVTPVGNYSVADGDTIDLVAIAMGNGSAGSGNR